MLYHLRGEIKWDERLPVQLISSSYQRSMRGFRMLIQTGQLEDKVGELLMVWHTQLTPCGGPQCLFNECQIRAQIEAQERAARLIQPLRDISKN